MKPVLFTTMSVLAFAAREPPAEMKLWNAGKNPTDYGVHVWSDRSAKEVTSFYQQRGNPLLVDVEHGGPTDQDGDARETAGYARLELRNGEPWLVFDWSDVGAEQIKTGQRRFLSPEYDVDKKTGEIVRLVRVSLVADPGTHRARMLASANNSTRRVKAMLPPMLRAALNAALSAEDPKGAIKKLMSELDKAEDTGGEVDETAAAPEPKPGEHGEGTKDPGEPVVAAAEGDPAPGKEVEAAAGTPPGKEACATDEGPEKMAAAAAKAGQAKPETQQVAAAAAAAPAAVDKLAQDFDAFKRDTLLKDEGHRLVPAVRVWASSQSYDVVKGLIDASPAAAAPSARVRATRGNGQGGTVPNPRDGLKGDELRDFMKMTSMNPAEKKEFERVMAGTSVVSGDDDFKGPHTRPDGTFRVAGTGWQYLEQEAERVKAAAAATK